MASFLLADDDPLLAQAAAERVVATGHRAAICCAVGDLFAALQREDPDVLIQGLGMEDLDVERLLDQAEVGDARLRLLVLCASVSLDEVAALVAADTPVDIMGLEGVWEGWAQAVAAV